MNAYRIDSYRGAYGRKKYRAPAALRLLHAIFSVLWEVLCAHAETVRAALVLTGLVVILGIVGAMECGAMPFSVGIPICALISVFALRAHFTD